MNKNIYISSRPHSVNLRKREPPPTLKNKVSTEMQKGSEMTIENYTATLLMVNFMKFTLFVNDNVRSFSRHDRGFAPNATLLSLMSSCLFEREQTLLPPPPTQYPDSSSYLSQKEHDFLQELRKLRIRKCCGSGSVFFGPPGSVIIYTDPDPSIIKQSSTKNLESLFCDFFMTFYLCTFKN